MQDVTVARLQSTRVKTPLSFKRNVLRVSLSVVSQNIPCATLKRRRSWVFSVHYMSLWSLPFKPPHRVNARRDKNNITGMHKHSW